MQSKIVRYSVFSSAALLVLALGGCVSGNGGFTLRSTADTVEPQGASYAQVFTATREALDELGVTLRSSRDRRIIIGQIPPFKVKAVFEPASAEVRLQGVELDRNCWKRDSLKREWVRACEGKPVRRKGVNTLDGAIALWTEAVRARVR